MKAQKNEYECIRCKIKVKRTHRNSQNACPKCGCRNMRYIRTLEQ